MTAWTILVECHQRNISESNIEIRLLIYDKNIFKVLYIGTQGKQYVSPGGHDLLRIMMVKQIGTGSSKEPFRQIILKLVSD